MRKVIWLSYLIVTDIDHTLLNDDGELVDVNVEALDLARAQGAVVVLSTARSFTGASIIHKELKLDTPIIVSNGTLIVTPKGKEIHAETISKNKTIELLNLFNESQKYWSFRTATHAYIHPNFDVTHGPYVLEKNYTMLDYGAMLEHIHNNGHCPVITASLFGEGLTEFYNSRDWSKLNLRPDFYPPSHFYNYEAMSLISSNASKGNAAKWLQNHLGLNDSPVIALGDSPADATMFSLGIGVAPQNAKPEVKNKADWVAPHCNNGAVAAAINKFVL